MGQFKLTAAAWLARFLGFVTAVLLMPITQPTVTTIINNNVWNNAWAGTVGNVLLAFILAEIALPRLYFMLLRQLVGDDS